MGSAWGPDIYDIAAWTSSQAEEVDFFDYEEMLAEDVTLLSYHTKAFKA